MTCRMSVSMQEILGSYSFYRSGPARPCDESDLLAATNIVESNLRSPLWIQPGKQVAALNLQPTL